MSLINPLLLMLTNSLKLNLHISQNSYQARLKTPQEFNISIYQILLIERARKEKKHLT